MKEWKRLVAENMMNCGRSRIAGRVENEVFGVL
jgi:hypothetical protein